VERKRADPAHKRGSISQHPENRHSLGVRNAFREQNCVNIPTYSTYAANHPHNRAKAGPAIIIRKDIKPHELAKYETDNIQAMNINIEHCDEDFTISAIYWPPRHN
jgi:hypothetical protein